MIPPCEAARPLVHRPKRRLPAGAVDCHFHVFGPASEFPYAEGRSYTPPDATLADYERMADSFGIARAVIIQPSVYGFDNRRTLRAMAESRLPMRAVIVAHPDITEREIEDLHAAGVRGVRLNLLFNAGLALGAAGQLADRIRAFGWHLQILADVAAFDDLDAFAARVNLPLVFDHLGHVHAAEPDKSAGFRRLVALVRDERAWVKISGAYRTTSRPDVPYDDLRPCVDALIKANARQLIWGTDWPHPSIPVAMPDDTALLDMAIDWIGSDDIAHDIFAANPARLYGF